MRTEGSIEIDRPVEDVFRLTNEHVAEWSQIVVSEEIIEDRPEKVGSTFKTVTEDHGRRMEFQGVVTRYEPPRRSAIHMTGDAFEMDVEYEFEDLGGRTRVTQRSDVTGKGVFKVILFLTGWLMKRSSCDALDKELRGLKQFCEQPSDHRAT